MLFDYIKEKFNRLFNSLNDAKIDQDIMYNLYPIKIPIKYQPIKHNDKTSERLKKIINKIELLRVEKKNYIDLSFNKPYSMEEIVRVEKAYKTKFPEEYIEFITTIGTNNGPGVGGIYGPNEKPNNFDKYNERLFSRSFKFSTNETESIIINDKKDKCGGCKCDDFSGCFIICDHDMNYYDFIVLNGEQGGKLWSYIDGWMLPKYKEVESCFIQYTFYDFIQEWLNIRD